VIPVRKIFSDSRGAAAIEYALIGALIGIGLVGALIGTKTSLSAIFGTAGTQMAAGTSDSGAQAGPTGVTSQRPVAPATSSTRFSFWNNKTLSSKVVTSPDANSRLTTFTYADGSSASYLVRFDNTGALTGETQVTYPFGGGGGRTTDSGQFTFDAAGNQTTFFYTYRNPDGSLNLTASASASGWTEYVTPYTNGQPGTVYATYPVSAAELNQGKQDEIYFRAMSQ
jgi:Flp pilus assembly pilin Flp